MLLSENEGNRLKTSLSEKTVGILLLPDSPAVEVHLMVDCFNRANETRAEPYYDLVVIDRTEDGTFSGLDVHKYHSSPPDQAVPFDYIVLFGGQRRVGNLNPSDVKWLLYHGRKEAIIGAIGNSVVPLADLGLFTNTPIAVHWLSELSLRETYPKLKITGDLFVHSGRRFTCCGGMATLDVSLYFIAQDCGDYLASYVADILVYSHSQNAARQQRSSSDYHLSISDQRLLKAVKLMQRNLENPLDVNDIADQVGLGIRNLQRLFKRHLDTSPVSYYKHLRLWNARRLLLDSSIRISEIALTCGFVSSSHFTSCYKQYFSVTPSRERRSRSSFHSVHPKHRESMRMSKSMAADALEPEKEHA